MSMETSKEMVKLAYAALDEKKAEDIRIIDIAGNVGFENSKYFIQVFKKRTGMTPQEYRKLNV